MKIIRLIGHLHFAIMLVGLTTLFVIGGTFLEAWTDSHQFAASLTYSSLPFHLLLSGFFFNILISALLRWPFKKRHIPFLITHLGLLMMILGTALKGWYGIQGTMAILEGSASSEVLVSGTGALTLQPRDHSPQTLSDIPSKWQLITRDAPPIEARVLGKAPDGEVTWTSWIKKGKASLQGFPSIPFSLNDTLSSTPPTQIRLQESTCSPWAFYTFTSSDHETLQNQLKKHHFHIAGCSEKSDQKDSAVFTLSPLPALIPDTYPDCSPFLALIRNPDDNAVHLYAMDTIGTVHEADFPENRLDSVVVYDKGFGGYALQSAFPFSSLPTTITDHRAVVLFAIANAMRDADSLAEPLLLLKQACQQSGDDFPNTLARLLNAWHASGRWLYPADRPLPPELARALIHLTPSTSPNIRWTSIILTELEERILEGDDLITSLERLQWPLTQQLKNQRKDSGPVKLEELPILLHQLTQQVLLAAEQLPPPPNAPETLTAAEALHFFSVSLRAQAINLGTIAGSEPIDKESIRALYASTLLRQRCCEILEISDDVSDRRLIQTLGTLAPKDPKTEAIKEALTIFAKRIAIDPPTQELTTTIQRWLPPIPPSLSDYEAIAALIDQTEFAIESPLARQVTPKPARTKIEERVPLLAIELRKGQETERHLLPFDPTAQALAWPALNGSLLLAYHPKKHLLPYKLRLRDARQINYSNSSQAQSYEADLLITNGSGLKIETTLSMNNVYETSDGYRFYLSALTPETEREVQRVQIVVNYDPVKYWLTYPGGILVALGIFGLFGPSLLKTKRNKDLKQ